MMSLGHLFDTAELSSAEHTTVHLNPTQVQLFVFCFIAVKVLMYSCM